MKEADSESVGTFPLMFAWWCNEACTTMTP